MVQVESHLLTQSEASEVVRVILAAAERGINVVGLAGAIINEMRAVATATAKSPAAS